MKKTTQFHIRPARPEEAGLFYTPHPEEDRRLGTVGHVRMDFGRSGNEFWHTWWPRGPEELNSPAFKAELQQIVGKLREDVLKSRFATTRHAAAMASVIHSSDRMVCISRSELRNSTTVSSSVVSTR